MPDEKSVTLKTLKAQDKAIDSFFEEVAAANERLSRLLVEAITEGDTIRAADIARVKATVQQALVDSGYYEVADKLLNEHYQTILDRNISDLEKMGVEPEMATLRYKGQTLEDLKALKNLDLMQFNSMTESAATNLTRVMVNHQLGVLTRKQAIEEAAGQLGTLQRNAKTWVDTASSAFYRTSSARLAVDNGIEKFQYFGPDDKITRPFCKDHLNEVKTYEEWSKISNPGQPGPVTVYGGGYLCRHSLAPIVEAE